MFVEYYPYKKLSFVMCQKEIQFRDCLLACKHLVTLVNYFIWNVRICSSNGRVHITLLEQYIHIPDNRNVSASLHEHWTQLPGS